MNFRILLCSILIIWSVVIDILAQDISISPNNGQKGSSFSVTVTGSETFFQQGTTTCVQILASPDPISLTNINVQNLESLTGTVSIPANTILGTYSARVYLGPGCTDPFFNWTCDNCFTVTPCSTVVTTSAASGDGSLRDVVACAESGSTITFNNVSSVFLDMPAFPIDKPLTLDGTAQNITITSFNPDNTLPLLNVNMPLTLNGLKLLGNTTESLIFQIGPNGSIDVNNGSLEKTLFNKQ